MICARAACPVEFEPARKHQKYCSAGCRRKTYEEKFLRRRLRRPESSPKAGRKSVVRRVPARGRTPSPSKSKQGLGGPLGDALMTSEQVRQFLGVSRWQMRAWRTSPEGGGPAFMRIGRRVRYLPSDVLQFVRIKKVRKQQETGRSRDEKD